MDGALSYVHPVQGKADAHEGLAAFGQEVGVPREMVPDNSKEQTEYGTEFMRLLRKWRTISRSIELYSPWQNLAENGTIQMEVTYGMAQSTCWIYSHTAKLGSRKGIEVATPDISELLDFEFYELC